MIPRIAPAPGPCAPRSLRHLALGAALLAMLAVLPAVARAQLPPLRPEIPEDPPGVPAPPGSAAATASSAVTFGRFSSVQVNLSASGANIVGDAANEPTIAVDPLDHRRMAIGWRQFDTVGSNFRQAGFAWSTDGGASWTSGKIQPGAFRSDPVLAVAPDGRFLYLSLGNAGCDLFASTNGGRSWGPAVSAYGGDKPWFTVDAAADTGRGNLYQAWNGPGTMPFDRSTDGGASFLAPSDIPLSPLYGTLDVAADGTLYVAGINSATGAVVVDRSLDARDGVEPTFATSYPFLGGSLRGGVAPNPQGLLGQVWVAVDRSASAHAGWVYALASVQTATDPLDVNFVRSTDGGVTWSAPVRVNDDPPGHRAYQWFGTMSVSPGGRIDAAWNDTRGSADSTTSAVYYAYSDDGGATWSPNQQVSPTWNSMVGFPKQSKIGDYDHMVSDATGANLAYAATFHGGQDVYYLRLEPNAVAAVAPPAAAARLLGPVTPDPFRTAATVTFQVPAPGARVRLEVFDPAGRRVATLADGARPGGPQRAVWDGRDSGGHAVAPGVYLCRYRVGEREESRPIVRLR